MKKERAVPRILLCAPASGSGKTLITCGILQALVDRGKKGYEFLLPYYDYFAALDGDPDPRDA